MLTAIFQKPILGAAGSVQRRLPHGGGFVYVCVCERERERDSWSTEGSCGPARGLRSSLLMESIMCWGLCLFHARALTAVLPACSLPPGKAAHPSILHGMKEM